MHRVPATVLIVFALLTAGCLGGSEDPEPTDATGTDAVDPSSPGAQSLGGSEANGTSAEGPSLMVPPAWQTGEWWTIRLESPLSGAPVEFTRVVAGTEGQDYLVGQPEDEWSTEALVFHVPGLGEVARDDLSFEVHDVRFNPLSFPLTDGKTWTTAFEGAQVEATATHEADGTVSIHYCCGRNITASYDPGMGAISQLDVEGLLSYQVTDHGFNHEGVVTVPHGHDLIFQHGRVAGALDTGLEPAPPVESIEVSDDYQRMSFVQIAGPLGLAGEQPASSAYIERATGPDGTTYETQHLPTDGGSFTVQFFETTELGGTWELEHVSGGPGLAFTEGIAYHVFNMQLPDGHLIGDHSEHVTD